MARIRSIHPGIFTDEAYMSLSFPARELLKGLWCESDDRGVFEWKLRTIKARIIPADAVDMNELMAEMVEHNLICQFEFDGKKYGAVRNFLRHQRPKAPKIMHPVTDEIVTFVGGNRHGSSVTDDDDVMDFPRDLTAAERQRRKRERDRIKNEDDGGNCHGSSVTDGEMSRQMEDVVSKEDSEAKASGASAPAEVVEISPVKALFDLGVRILTEAGQTEKQARQTVGRLRSMLGDAEVASLLVVAERKTDPATYLFGAMNKKGKFVPAGCRVDADGVLCTSAAM